MLMLSKKRNIYIYMWIVKFISMFYGIRTLVWLMKYH